MRGFDTLMGAIPLIEVKEMDRLRGIIGKMPAADKHKRVDRPSSRGVSSFQNTASTHSDPDPW
jgi:hypothetical protein